MSLEQQLLERSNSKCELCNSIKNLRVFAVLPEWNGIPNNNILICSKCETQINDPKTMTPNHWRSLNDTMWTEIPAVQVMVWRMLNRLRTEGWPQDLIEMLYLEDNILAWAKAEELNEEVIHLDSNGNLLQAGDTVILTQDLKVKGANFTAKRGTAVRRISLVQDNSEHIEGKVDGQHIVILTKYVKKSNK